MKALKGIMAVLSFWAAYGVYSLVKGVQNLIDGYNSRGNMFDFLGGLMRYADQIVDGATQPMNLIGLVSGIIVFIGCIIWFIRKRSIYSKRAFVLMMAIIVAYVIYGIYVVVNLDLINATIELLDVMDSMAVMRFGSKLDKVITLIAFLKYTLMFVAVAFIVNGLNGLMAMPRKQKGKQYSNELVKRSKFTKTLVAIKRDWLLYLFCLPMLLWFGLIIYKPMYGLIMAFQDYSPFQGIRYSEFVGFDNFKFLLAGSGSGEFLNAIRNTLLINGYLLIFAFPAPIILALMFNEVKRENFRKFLQTVTYLPNFISVVVVMGIVIEVLNPSSGVINNLLLRLNLISEPIKFLTSPSYYRSIYVLSDIWKVVGFNSIIYFAALMAVPNTLYEAAEVDGASKLQQMWHISLPSISSTIIILLILRIGGMLAIGYEKTILLQNPLTMGVSEVVGSYVYKIGVVSTFPMYSVATAAGLFNSVIGFILVYGANKIANKFKVASLW